MTTADRDLAATGALLLAEAFADLLESGPGPQELEADREAFSEERSFRRYAKRLCHALEIDTGP